MSNKELKLTQTIADMAYFISVKSGMSIEEAMNFVYNSETLDKILSEEDMSVEFSSIESALLIEWKLG